MHSNIDNVTEYEKPTTFHLTQIYTPVCVCVHVHMGIRIIFLIFIVAKSPHVPSTAYFNRGCFTFLFSESCILNFVNLYIYSSLRYKCENYSVKFTCEIV
jgi:hypothetical protein